MKTVLVPLLETLADVLRSRALLHLEMLAMRQQLAMVAEGDRKRLSFRPSERIFWVWLYRLWPTCLQTLMIFKPDTLVRWHRKGFRLYWIWKSRRRQGGRPAIEPVGGIWFFSGTHAAVYFGVPMLLVMTYSI